MEGKTWTALLLVFIASTALGIQMLVIEQGEINTPMGPAPLLVEVHLSRSFMRCVDMNSVFITLTPIYKQSLPWLEDFDRSTGRFVIGAAEVNQIVLWQAMGSFDLEIKKDWFDYNGILHQH